MAISFFKKMSQVLLRPGGERLPSGGGEGLLPAPRPGGVARGQRQEEGAGVHAGAAHGKDGIYVSNRELKRTMLDNPRWKNQKPLFIVQNINVCVCVSKIRMISYSNVMLFMGDTADRSNN